MCRFCTQHGDGKVWYLEAENYIADLESDLARRGYLIDFVQGFDSMRSKALVGARLLDIAPRPLREAATRRLEARQQLHHYGQPVPIEECERILTLATSIVRLPCVCRTAAGTPDDGVCLAVTVNPVDPALAEAFKGYENGPGVPSIEHLTREHAIALLHDCEDRGLMHSVWTFLTPMIGAICNCDMASGCMAMKMTVGHDIKVMWRGEYVATLAEESCTSCGACAGLCPFHAIDFDRKTRQVTLRQEDCWGCGVCRAKCRPSAITLVPRASVPQVAAIW